jgi:predicted Zn-dependent peptidase
VNITIAIAGDVAQADVKRLAAKYFSALPGLPPPPGVITVEPPQEGEKRAEVMSPSQPFLMIGYKRPDQRDKDDPVFDVLGAILSSGRTGLLYKEMVRDKKIALAAQAQSSFPGSKYPNLFLFFVAPSRGRTVEENEKACYEILERLKKEKVDDETLNRVKTKIRASLIRGLDSNSGMAEQLASYYVNYGDWRKLFTGIDDIRKVTADDVQRVVREYFTPATRTVVYTVIPKTPAAEGGK